MGYRSYVTFAFYPKSEHDDLFPAIKLWVDENWPKTDGSDYEICYTETRPESNLVLVTYEDIKWYDDYDFVKKAWAATRLFEEAFDTETYETHRAHWEYVRMGEGSDDVEEGGSSFRDYRVGVERRIVVN